MAFGQPTFIINGNRWRDFNLQINFCSGSSDRERRECPRRDENFGTAAAWQTGNAQICECPASTLAGGKIHIWPDVLPSAPRTMRVHRGDTLEGSSDILAVTLFQSASDVIMQSVLFSMLWGQLIKDRSFVLQIIGDSHRSFIRSFICSFTPSYKQFF